MTEHRSIPAITTAGYPEATVTPLAAGVTEQDIPHQVPLPITDEPAELPLVRDPSGQDEPLLSVDHLPRIIDLATYHRAGWPGAMATSVARADAVARLASVASVLPAGFGIAVFDAWRSLALQRTIFDHFYGPGSALERGFVSPPSTSPATPPPHLTGGTFDLTLTWQGQPLALGTAFDEFTERAHTRALEHESGLDRTLRRLLVHSMARAGFVSYLSEWWHFEYGTRRWAAHWLNEPRYGVASLAT